MSNYKTLVIRKEKSRLIQEQESQKQQLKLKNTILYHREEEIDPGISAWFHRILTPPRKLELVFFCAQKNPDALPRRGYTAYSREPGRTRTCDRLLRRQMLYPAELRVHTPLGEEKKLSGRQDSNLRPSGPKPDALPPAPLPEHNNELLFAERLGLEPRGRYRDHSLAGCCITTLPPFR